MVCCMALISVEIAKNGTKAILFSLVCRLLRLHMMSKLWCYD